MIGQVRTKDGQKIVEPISGSIPTGNPVGTLLTTYKKIQPRNYLYCDGSTFNASQYPALYLYLGTNVLPDYRECVMVGAEENTTDNIASHDVYAQGEFKDDQVQNITGTLETAPAGGTSPTSDTGAFQKESSPNSYWYSGGSANRPSVHSFDASRVARAGTTTHGKQKAVYVYIKAVDGVDISDEDTFLVTVKNFVDERVTRAESYSTEEVWTGGYWYDGKKIYRKVFTGLSVSLSSNNFSNILPQSSVPNIAFIISAKGWYSNTICFNFTEARIQNSYISVESTYGGSRTIDTFCIKYTKTTD